MKVERNVEGHCVGDYSPYKVRQNQTCSWVMQDEFQGHNWEVDDGFGVDEEGEPDAEDYEGGNDKRVGPGEDVASEILIRLD